MKNPHKQTQMKLFSEAISYKFQLECEEKILVCGSQGLQEFDLSLLIRV